MPGLHPPCPLLPFTEYPSQKGTVLLQPGKGPRKMTVDLVIDGSSQTLYECVEGV